MNIFLDDSELTEIKPINESDDKGLVISPKVNEKRQEISELRKEITAIDTIESTARRAAELNNVGRSNAAKYANGEGLSEDGRARVLGIRNNIQDLAVVKLMETLNLLNPEAVDKERDKVAIMTGLSQVIEKLSPAKNENDKPVVHLHMYAPKQKAEKDYDIIEA